jgi:hypothetical protein
MELISAVIAFISGLFLLGHVQIHTVVAGYQFQVSVLQIIAFMMALLVFGALLWLLRGFGKWVASYAAA